MKYFSLIFVFSLALFVVQCSDPPVSSLPDELSVLYGGGPPNTPNNLSVPTILIGGNPFTGVIAPLAEPIYPTGVPLSGFPINPIEYYYVQGIHTWQGTTDLATQATVTADWADNLTGSAKLMVGKPIRIEIGLFDDTGLQMQGFNVVKLEPEKLDRESAYGILAMPDGGGGFYATAENLPVRVYDIAATFSVQNLSTLEYVVPLTPISAEINATGKIVYGYNLRVNEQGSYNIEMNFPSVTITGVDAGTIINDQTVALDINVVQGGGPGGGGH